MRLLIFLIFIFFSSTSFAKIDEFFCEVDKVYTIQSNHYGHFQHPKDMGKPPKYIWKEISRDNTDKYSSFKLSINTEQPVKKQNVLIEYPKETRLGKYYYDMSVPSGIIYAIEEKFKKKYLSYNYGVKAGKIILTQGASYVRITYFQCKEF